MPDELNQPELPDSSAIEDTKLEAKREHLLNAVNSCRLNNIEEKVAWLLNNFPNTRDSDITLQIRYWQKFESALFDGGPISVRDYYRLSKLTSLSRARATIQNELKLFQASDEIKKRRKQKQETEHTNAIKKRANYLRYVVFIDESGKTQDYIVVGSMWFLHGTETLRIYHEVNELKKKRNFEHELHFKQITEQKLPLYIEVADYIAANSGVLSFKIISVPRRGIADMPEALLKLTYHLLVRGLEHEHSSGRAPLPRGIQVIKDAEAEGQDKLFVAELADRMKQASATQFNNELYVETFSAESSERHVLLQLTDLFVSSVGRVLNVTGERNQPKDKFADYFLSKLGIVIGQQQSDAVGDMAVHISL